MRELSKRPTPTSLEQVANRGKDSRFADQNISDQQRRVSPLVSVSVSNVSISDFLAIDFIY